MNNTPLRSKTVSIITMTYKKFDGILRTINSVSKQTYNDIEYIISDDGSDNFPYDYLENYIKDKKINNYKIIDNCKNVGTVKNANIACKSCTGEIVMFLSSGDMFVSDDVVEKVVDYFNKSSCDLLCARRIAFYERPCYFLPHFCSIPIIKSLKSRKKQYRAFITSHFWDMASGSAMYYSKNILEKNNYFDEKYRLWEDGPFIEKYLRNNKMDFAYDFVAVWYELGGVSTGDVNPLLEQDRLLFDRTDRQYFKKRLSPYQNRYIEYILLRSECNDKKSLNKLRMKYPFIMISHIVYKCVNFLFKSIDRIYLFFNKKWERKLQEVKTE